MNKMVIKGKSIIGGISKGKALISKNPFMFAHGVEPKSGKIIDKKLPLCGKKMKNTVFIFPHGKGSTTGSMWFLETIRCNNAPAAIINQETEMVIATGAILGDFLYHKKIPIIDRPDNDPLLLIENGDLVRVNGDKGLIEIKK